MLHRPFLRTAIVATTVSAFLAACGGGNSAGGSAGAAGGTLTIASATPALHSTTLDLSKAATSGNNTRAADSFSSTPYCEVFAEGMPGANGQVYAVQVYFRQSDKAPLHASVIGGTGASLYAVFDNASGSPISGLTVDTAARTVTFNNKVLSGSAGEKGTVSGTWTFPANSTTAACGN